MQPTKRDVAIKLIQEGKELEALKILGKIAFKKNETLGQAIIHGREALIHPSMYKQLKMNPDQMVKDGIEAMKQLLKI